jgi:hypothetical protein
LGSVTADGLLLGSRLTLRFLTIIRSPAVPESRLMIYPAADADSWCDPKELSTPLLMVRSYTRAARIPGRCLARFCAREKAARVSRSPYTASRKRLPRVGADEVAAIKEYRTVGRQNRIKVPQSRWEQGLGRD